MSVNATEFERAANVILRAIGDLKNRLSPRDLVMMQIGMRASHIEEALAQGEVDRARGHVQKLVELARRIP